MFRGTFLPNNTFLGKYVLDHENLGGTEGLAGRNHVERGTNRIMGRPLTNTQVKLIRSSKIRLHTLRCLVSKEFNKEK